MQENERISRRRFIASSALGSAVGLTVPSLLKADGDSTLSDPWQMRLSTSSIHYLHLPIEQACQSIADLGFSAIDIWSAHAGCPHLDDVANRLGTDGLKQLLKKTGLRLCSFSVYRGGYARYAKLLGDVGGGVAVRGSSGPCKPSQTVARMREFLESLKPEIELAEKNDSYLAIENHGNALLDSLDSFKAFVDLNKSARLGIALAPYHLQALDASIEEAISICGRQLFYFYAWQRADGVKQLPGHGPTDFGPWIAKLAETRYGGYVNPFMHGDIDTNAMSKALAKSRAYLMQCRENERKSR